jgi:hypothetical protein
MLGKVGHRRERARPPHAARFEGEVIVMGAPRQDLAESYVAYRKAIEIAEGARQRAIAAALVDHRRALEEIEAAYRRGVAAARWRYSQRDGYVAQAVRASRSRHWNAFEVLWPDLPAKVAELVRRDLPANPPRSSKDR